MEKDFGIKLSQIEERLVKTETSLAYIEDFLLKIQDEALSQWKEIEQLKKQNAHLQSKLKEIEESEEMPHTKPPHY